MKSRTNNNHVEDFLSLIADRDKYYASESEKSLLRTYDACDDYKVSTKLIGGIWEFLKKNFSGLNRITKSTIPITILHTNAGTGKVLEACPSDNVFIDAMNNDYTCKKISDLLNAKSSLDFSYKSSISDISHYFINGDNGNTRKYDIIFTQPTASNYHRDIDPTALGRYDSLEYYSLRSLDFLTKGGYICILVHHSLFKSLKNNIELNNKAKFVQEIHNNRKFDEYGCLIYKKK